MYKRLFKRVCLSVLLLVVVVLRGLALYEKEVKVSDATLVSWGENYSDRVVTGYYSWNDRVLHYLDIGDVTKPMVVLIHGAPGSIATRKKFASDSELYNEFRFVMIDRLGYGKSGQGNTITDLGLQSDSLLSLIRSLDNENDRKPVIVGNSYAGAIVTKMLLDGEKDLSGGLIIAGGVSPDHQKVYGISYVIDLPILKQMIGPINWAANDEKLGHVDNLRTYLQNIDTISLPTYVIHGDEDTIAPIENAEYLVSQIDTELVTFKLYEGAGHAIPRNNYEDIRDDLRIFSSQIQ